MTQKQSKWGWWTTIALLGVAVLLLVYVLSAGPAAYFVQERQLTWEAFDTFYAPLLWVATRSDTANRVWNWYTGLWFSVDKYHQSG